MLVTDYAQQLAEQVTAGLARVADLLSTPAAARLLRAWGAVPREWRDRLLRLVGGLLRPPARHDAPPPAPHAHGAPPAAGGVTVLCTVTPLPGRRQKVTITIDGG